LAEKEIKLNKGIVLNRTVIRRGEDEEL